MHLRNAQGACGLDDYCGVGVVKSGEGEVGGRHCGTDSSASSSLTVVSVSCNELQEPEVHGGAHEMQIFYPPVRSCQRY